MWSNIQEKHFVTLQSDSKRERFYLEFVHIGRGGEEEKTPGLSFGYVENLEAFSKKIANKIKIKFTHKNYDWINNAKDRLPGWNMLNFKKAPINNIFTWFTEYEPISNKSKKKPKSKPHPNSVYSIHGIKLILNKKSKANLEKILCKKLGAKNKLSDGTFLYIEEGKKDKFETIILNCKSFKKARPYFKNCDEVVFDNMNAIHIVNNSKDKKVMWDLLVIEKKVLRK
jgi:hypothetical protein